MTLSNVANIADLVAALGIILSLLLVASEMRKNNAQARLSNWHSVLAALREHKRRTDVGEMADVLARGREDYDSLKPGEKIMFGQWMEELLQANEGLLQFRDASIIPREQLVRTATANFRWHFAFPGCRAWWRDSGLSDRWPNVLASAINDAVTYNERGSTPRD